MADSEPEEIVGTRELYDHVKTQHGVVISRPEVRYLSTDKPEDVKAGLPEMDADGQWRRSLLEAHVNAHST